MVSLGLPPVRCGRQSSHISWPSPAPTKVRGLLYTPGMIFEVESAKEPLEKVYTYYLYPVHLMQSKEILLAIYMYAVSMAALKVVGLGTKTFTQQKHLGWLLLVENQHQSTFYRSSIKLSITTYCNCNKDDDILYFCEQ